MENKKPTKTDLENKRLTEEIHEFLRNIDDACYHLLQEQADTRNFICKNLKKIHVRVDKLTHKLIKK